MSSNKKRRKLKTPPYLHNVPRTIRDVGKSMVACPQYPNEEPKDVFVSVVIEPLSTRFEETQMAATWPATKENTPVPPPSTQVIAEQLPKSGEFSAIQETATARKLSPAEQLALKKKNRITEKEKKEKVRYFFVTMKQLRTELGLTGPEIAAELGISDGGYSRMEQGYGVSLVLAMRVAEFFGKQVHEIWQLDRENLPSTFEE